MKDQLLKNIENPDKLEKMYRENKQNFSKSFAEISENLNSDLVKFWKIRLAPETESEFKGFLKLDLIVVISLSLLTGLLVKLPIIFTKIQTESFYMRNLAIIVFNGLVLFTFWKNNLFNKRNTLIYSFIIFVLLLYVNFLPYNQHDSTNLVFIHMPFLMWCLFGISFVSFDLKNTDKKIAFIRFNGEFLIMTGLILIAGGLLTAITIGLFSAIKINIEKFYIDYVVIIGSAASPIISSYLIQLYPNITSKITPVIARVFTPLVLITLFVYLISLLFSESKILEDRDLLILFNVMLLSVMVIIVFSISELNKSRKRNFNVLILFFLAFLALVINLIALIAIISRVAIGFTPNRTVVLISNLLIFMNLILILKNLYQAYFKANQLELVESTLAKYVTIYLIWTLIVIFVLPFLFNFN